ncbi:hypothetical protein C8R43DRAFT_1044382 [Mycena crocata]|nr:hypothetical protein C8R43DRAFT_1044382 [Mycena crocata]
MQISDDEQQPQVQAQAQAPSQSQRRRKVVPRSSRVIKIDPRPPPRFSLYVPPPESEEHQVEADVLPEAVSESDEEGDGTDAAEGEPEVDEPDEYELEDEEDEIEESRSPSVVARPTKSPLKIKFKMRGNAPAATRGRRTRATAIPVESEDSVESESEEEMPQNTRLTKRQAALAKARKGVMSSEESEDDDEPEPKPAPPSPTTSKRKRGAAIDPTELALRKEESARKRRNVSEKKLQNEKAETINRLLKKQSRPRGRRTTALSTLSTVATPAEVPTPGSGGGVRTPIGGMLTPLNEANPNCGSMEGMDGVEEAQHSTPQITPLYNGPPLPMTYRWISTSRPQIAATSVKIGDTKEEDENQGGMEVDPLAPRMSLSFSVPASLAPLVEVHQRAATQAVSVKLDSPSLPEKSHEKPQCGIEGCGKERRYRLVGGAWGAGACGMGHLKALSVQVAGQ